MFYIIKFDLDLYNNNNNILNCRFIFFILILWNKIYLLYKLKVNITEVLEIRDGIILGNEENGKVRCLYL